MGPRGKSEGDAGFGPSLDSKETFDGQKWGSKPGSPHVCPLPTGSGTYTVLSPPGVALTSIVLALPAAPLPSQPPRQQQLELGPTLSLLCGEGSGHITCVSSVH